MVTHEIPANRLNYIRMLQAVSKPELDPREIEDVIKVEASICYRLLRYLNSAVFSFSKEIHSIKHALSLLGEREVRRWVRLVATLGAAQDKSTELVSLALVRARFCELLSPKIQHGRFRLVLAGIAFLDRYHPGSADGDGSGEYLDRPGNQVSAAGRASRLRPLYQLMLAQESGEWEVAADWPTSFS
jgi:EAL and modified HD-GYP domain-containing signal transduction protein